MPQNNNSGPVGHRFDELTTGFDKPVLSKVEGLRVTGHGEPVEPYPQGPRFRLAEPDPGYNLVST